MNCQQFNLDEIEVQRPEVADVVRALVHTILFNRAFGLVKPKEVDAESFELTYVQLDESSIEKYVQDKTALFVETLHKDARGHLVVSFFDKRLRSMVFFKQEEKVCWEQWIIPVTLSTSTPLEASEKAARQAWLEREMTQRISYILRMINAKKDHIPPVTSSDITPFPYQISIPALSESWGGIEFVKRMLHSSAMTAQAMP